MNEMLAIYLPYIMSVNTILAMILAGNKQRRGWAMAFCGEFVWSYWIFLVAAWGLIPMNIFLIAVYFRNFRKWYLKSK